MPNLTKPFRSKPRVEFRPYGKMFNAVTWKVYVYSGVGASSFAGYLHKVQVTKPVKAWVYLCHSKNHAYMGQAHTKNAAKKKFEGVIK